MENTAFRHARMGTVFQLEVHRLTSTIALVPFWTGSFLIVGQKRGPIPWPFVVQI